MNPIPSRTRPLNSSAPMVLWLKPWESRSLPGLPRQRFSSLRVTIIERRFPSGGRRFCFWAVLVGSSAVNRRGPIADRDCNTRRSRPLDQPQFHCAVRRQEDERRFHLDVTAYSPSRRWTRVFKFSCWDRAVMAGEPAEERPMWARLGASKQAVKSSKLCSLRNTHTPQIRARSCRRPGSRCSRGRKTVCHR